MEDDDTVPISNNGKIINHSTHFRALFCLYLISILATEEYACNVYSSYFAERERVIESEFDAIAMVG